ncbi:AsmA family protein [Limnobacter parvus]|uniref:AsmA family protein n=1 Tax=Limnobacter parvus TaxID=2939690 RepID=A0ABT1XK35_9BURK|nr:AsmA family protein [Limnobacter parvus]MCR2747524.1 AsmA family protein [Limnobacter parvus]
MAAAIVIATITFSVVIFELMGWPFLAKPAERWLGETLERKVVLTQDDDEDSAFKLRLIGGVRLTLGNFELGAPSWSEAPYMVKGKNVTLELNYSDLLAWRGETGSALNIDTLKADVLDAHLERLADGQASWQFAGNDPDAESKPVPTFGLLAIKTGNVRYNDAQLDLDLNAELSLQEGQTDGDALKVSAQGDYQTKKLNIDLASTGVLPWVAKDADPIPVDLKITLGTAKLAFKGMATDALKLQKLSGRFVVSGPSLASAGGALGITLPNTPPFRTEGELIRDASTWKANFTNATIGESRLKGDFVFEGDKDQPLLTGVLKGSSLVLADLGPTVGAPVSKSNQVKNPSGRVLPDKPFDLPSLRAMNADIRIDIDNLDLGSEILKPLRPLRAHLLLTDGVLRISEIDAKTAQGEMAGMVQLDGREDVAMWEMDLKWEGVQLEQWLAIPRAAQEPPYFTGRMNGFAKLKGQGQSTAQILGSLAGTVRTQVRNGTMSHLVIEAAGLDAAEALGVWFRGDDVLQMTCAYADLLAEDGVLRPRVFVIDTKDSALWVNGGISMKTEALDLRVVVTPKDFSPMSLRTPLLVRGTMANPDVSLEKGPLAGKIAGAVLLSLINPLAALIPFVDSGTPDPDQSAENKGCYDLATRSKAQREKN